jgi:hypothetical protein
MIKQIFYIGFSCWLMMTGCSRRGESPVASDLIAATKLPAVAVGDYVGTFMMAEGEAIKVAASMARCTIAEEGDHYVVSFTGGTPALGPETPSIRNVIFARTPGSQVGVFHSLERDGSVAGIHVSTYMTNLNVEVLRGGTKLIFTGRK